MSRARRLGIPEIKLLALFTIDLTLSVTQMIEFYGARWKIESGFKELKQDIGSQSSQCRNPQSVMNHLNFSMMASTITLIYADRLKADLERRHKVRGRTGLPFRMSGALWPKPHLIRILIGFAQNQATPRKILLLPRGYAWWLDEFLGNFR